MQFIKFRNLVGVSHTEDEAKALAEEVHLYMEVMYSDIEEVPLISIL